MTGRLSINVKNKISYSEHEALEQKSQPLDCLAISYQHPRQKQILHDGASASGYIGIF